MSDQIVAWGCDTRFTTDGPLTARLEQELKTQGTSSGFLVEDDGTVRWTTTVHAANPAQAVHLAARTLHKAFRVAGGHDDIVPDEFTIIESTAVRL